MSLRIVFMGTPAFAVATLRRLVEDKWNICAVYTGPDKPKNRGMKLLPTPVKEFAVTAGIPVYQPLSCRDEAVLDQLRDLAPDVIVVAAYGKLLPEALLNIPRLATINVHSSILPQYRGAAPINWAVLNGDAETGVTIMHMASELDAGDIIAQRATPIGPNEDAQALYARLADLGGSLLVETVAAIERGSASRTPQDGAQATLAPMLSKELSPMDWTHTAQELHNQVRGLIPWPAAVTELGGKRCKVFSTVTETAPEGAKPGAVLEAGKGGVLVACGGNTALRILELQPDGGKRMKAADYLRGHPLPLG